MTTFVLQNMNCFFRKQVEASRVEAEKDGIVVPETLEEYCVKTQPKPSEEELDEFDLDDEGYPYEGSGMSV